MRCARPPASSTSRTWDRCRSTGGGAHAFLQGVLSNDLDRLTPGEAQYTLLTNERGGIVDDLIAYRREGGYLLVVNAGNRDIDMAHLRERCPGDATLVDESDGHGMLALQGPAALGLLAPLCEGIDPLSAAPFTFAEARVAGVAVHDRAHRLHGRAGRRADLRRRATRWSCGTRCIEAGAVPCGLGARDALRLEVCYPLHGNDITQETNAIEAGLGWVCAREQAVRRLRRARCSRASAARSAGSSLCAWTRSARCPRPGCPIVDGEDADRRGHERHVLAHARAGHRPGLRAVRPGRAGHRHRRRRSRAHAAWRTPRANRCT